MENVTITLPVNAWNIVLNALGGRPYAEVAELLEEIKKQAAGQLSQAAPVANENAGDE